MTSLGTVYEDDHWRYALEQGAALSVMRRPLATLLWRLMVDWPLAVQHGVSLAVHAVNALLVGHIARRLGLSLLAAVCAGALFAVHPLTVEATAYLSARADLGAALCLLVALACALEGWWLQAGGALLLACGFKETAIVGVLLVPLARQRWGLACGLLAVLVAFTAWYAASVWHVPPTWDWALTQLIAGGRLLTQFVWPNALSVSYDYAHMGVLAAVGCLAVTCAVALAAVLVVSVRPVVAVGLGMAIAVIALRVCLVTTGSVLNEHQFYLAVAGLSIATAACLERPTCLQ